MTTARPAAAATRRRFLQRALESGALVGGAALLGALAPRGARAAGPARLRLRELYEKDLSFSALAESLDGEVVAVAGYMAPPLKAESRFFVLTRRPMANCPFCNEAAEWPDDIVAVNAKRVVDVVPFNVGIVVRGRLSLGDARDPESGFFSRVRLEDAVFERA